MPGSAGEGIVQGGRTQEDGLVQGGRYRVRQCARQRGNWGQGQQGRKSKQAGKNVSVMRGKIGGMVQACWAEKLRIVAKDGT